MEVGDGFLLKNKTIRDKSGNARQLTLQDLTLHRFIIKGTTFVQDTMCDSKCMLDHIHKIGMAIRNSYLWVKMEVPIFLVMDNAGGHETNDAKREYKQILLDKHNIIIDWQIPNLPETNMLDLGIWMTVQSSVEYIHKNLVMKNDILAESVVHVFDEINL